MRSTWIKTFIQLTKALALVYSLDRPRGRYAAPEDGFCMGGEVRLPAVSALCRGSLLFLAVLFGTPPVRLVYSAPRLHMMYQKKKE